MAPDLKEVGQVFTKFPAFIMLGVPVLVIWPRLGHRWLLPLVTPLVACKEAVGDGVAGGGKPAASAASSSEDVDGVTSGLLMLPLVPLPVLSVLPSLSRDRTGKT